MYAVRSAFARSRFFENLDPGWKAAIIAHYGVFAMPEYVATFGEARMGRFGRAAAWRDALHICDTAALLGPRPDDHRAMVARPVTAPIRKLHPPPQAARVHPEAGVPSPLRSAPAASSCRSSTACAATHSSAAPPPARQPH